jgi:hypothetical protein
MSGTPWTPEEDALILSEYGAGTTRDEIAELLPERSPWAVNSRLALLPRPPRPKYKRRKGTAKAWTEEDDIKLREGVESGLGYLDIGREIGRSYSAVVARATKTNCTMQIVLADLNHVPKGQLGVWPEDMPHYQDDPRAPKTTCNYWTPRKQTATLGGVSDYG